MESFMPPELAGYVRAGPGEADSEVARCGRNRPVLRRWLRRAWRRRRGDFSRRHPPLDRLDRDWPEALVNRAAIDGAGPNEPLAQRRLVECRALQGGVEIVGEPGADAAVADRIGHL